MRLREPEHGHDRIADVLLNPPAVPLERGAHLLEVPRHHLAERFGIQALAETRGALQVGEDDRDGLAKFLRRQRGLEGRPAESAKPKPIGVLLPATWTDRHTLGV